MAFEKYLERLNKFYVSLEHTSIMILYFSSRLDRPKVKDNFKHWVINGHEFFLTRRTKNDQYIYLYPKDDLKILTCITRRYPLPYNTASDGAPLYEYDAKIINPKPDPVKGNTHIGNHITIGIYKDSTTQKVLWDSHKTLYRELESKTALRRRTNECEFFIADANLKSFGDTVCLDSYLSPSIMKVKLAFTQQNEFAAVQNMFEIITKSSGGASPNTHIHNNKVYKIHIGKQGGRYIVVNKAKKYIKHKQHQKAGATLLEYKQITCMTDKFINFLQSSIINKVFDLEPDIDDVRVIYDAYSELNENGSEHIVVIYEYDQGNYIDLFFIDSKMALAACYADQMIKSGVALDEYEQSAYNTIMNLTYKVPIIV